MLKLQYSGHLMWRADSLEKTLILAYPDIEGGRRRGRQRTRWLGGITDSMDMSLSKLRETLKDRGAWCTVVHGVSKSWTWLSNWTVLWELPWSQKSNKNDKMLKMINEYRMDDTRNLYLMIPKEIIRLGNNHQCLVKPFSTAGTRWTPPKHWKSQHHYHWVRQHFCASWLMQHESIAPSVK